MSQNARIGKSSPVISQVNVARISLRSHTIKDWQDAINSARNELMPRRKSLYELYDNLKLDGHLSAVMGKRIQNVTNKKVAYVQDGSGEQLQDNINDYILRTPWFYDFLQGSMEVVPFGTTLLELVPKAGMIEKCEVFPRANVVPEFGHISQDATNPMDPWLMYREDKYYSTYLVEVGKPRDLGAMMIALPYILYKRGVFGDWAQFAELFGMPFRVGKYNPWDESTRQKLMTALAEMGGAGYTVIPDGTSLEFIQASTGQGQSSLYKDLVEVCNSELSKIFLGQTMTTDQGSSRSQGEVHERVEDGITLADMKRTEFLLNWELHPRLMKLGYPVTDKGRFEFDLTRNLPLEKRIELDMKVSEQLGGQIPARYWYETYGVPEPGKGDKVIVKTKPEASREPEKQPESDEEGDPAAKDSASMRKHLDKLYAHRHDKDVAAGDDLDLGGSDPIMEELAKAIHDGRLQDGWVDAKLMAWTTDQLTRAVTGGDLVDDEAGPQSAQLNRWMRENVAMFSGMKTYQTLRAATDELMDEEGQFRTFSDFKQRILAIDETYNKRYLRAEYNHALASAQMAERWGEIQDQKELFPYLRYSTVGDDRVRPDHQRLDGVEKHVNDNFWKTHFPPNGWGCRCDVEQVRRPSGTGRDLPPDQLPPLRQMFAGNPGIDGIIFPKNHPYYNAPRGVRGKVEKAVKELKAAKKEAARDIDTVPQGTPVSKALTTKASKKFKEIMRHTMAVIDSLHGDGALKPIPMRTMAVKRAYGSYRSTWREALDIRLSSKIGDHRHLTLAHEVGHWLDHIGLGSGSAWGTAKGIRSKEMQAVFDAMDATERVQGIRKALDAGFVVGADGEPAKMSGRVRAHYEYLMQPVELWARAYSQYVAARSGDSILGAELDLVRGRGEATGQWSDKDFKSVQGAIDLLFRSKGWTRPK